MRLLAVAVAAALVLGLLPPASAASAEAPTLSLRDNWDTMTVLAGEAVPPTNARTTVDGIEAVQAGGALHDAVRTVTTQVLAQDVGGVATTSTVTVTSWLRDSDGAILKRVIRTSTGVTGLPAQETLTETIYDAPCAQYAWPLEVGKAWTSTCSSTTTTTTALGAPTTAPLVETQSWKVVAEESRTVVAGTFHTFVIEQRLADGTLVRAWYAPAACNVVRSESFGPSGAPLTATELSGYTCRAAEAKATAPPPSPTPPVTMPPPEEPASSPTPASTSGGGGGGSSSGGSGSGGSGSSSSSSGEPTSPARTPAPAPTSSSTGGTDARSSASTAGSGDTSGGDADGDKDTPAAPLGLLLGAGAAVALLSRRRG